MSKAQCSEYAAVTTGNERAGTQKGMAQDQKQRKKVILISQVKDEIYCYQIFSRKSSLFLP